MNIEEEISNAACEILREHGPDGHIDGHEQLTEFILTCIAAEREACAQLAQDFVWYETENCGPDEANEFIARAIRARSILAKG